MIDLSERGLLGYTVRLAGWFLPPVVFEVTKSLLSSIESRTAAVAA